MPKPEPCGKCGAEPQERRHCPHCGEAEWVLQHGAHYMQGAAEVFGCSCPAPHTALGRRAGAAKERQAARVEAGKPTNRPVSTPEMARKAAAGIARGVPPSRALREAGYPQATSHACKLNKRIRTELARLGKRYIKIGQDLTPEDQENLVRGMLYENVIMRSDKGVQSAKQLGADKRVAMWQPDSQVGMVIIRAPEVPKLTHPIKLVQARYRDEDGI